MRETTKKRHKAVREAYKALPPMPAMKAYVVLGERFGLSDDHIRRILRKNRFRNNRSVRIRTGASQPFGQKSGP